MAQSPLVRIVLQRVSSASVTVDGGEVGSIGQGLCLLVGVEPEDGAEEVAAAVEKVAGLRVFADSEGKMNLSLRDVGGEVLVVSQFTLLGNVAKGRRPSFTGAADPVHAHLLIDEMSSAFRDRGIETAEGSFGAMMEVRIINDGPVTLVLDVTEGSVR